MRRPLAANAGYSLVEVMVAITILLVGGLGTVTLIDGANATTLTTKQREGATNLAREIAEVARSLDYDALTTADAPAALQTRASLADVSANTGWQIERRGTVYTVALSACAFDDGKDGAGTHPADENYCAGSAAAGTADKNPDDYRKLDLTITWAQRGGRTGSVPQTAIVNNPSGGLGPRITAFDCTTGCDANDVVTSGTSIGFQATSQPAATFQWAADDGVQHDPLTAGPTSWSWFWDIGTVGTFSCATAANWTLDGTYVLNAQAYDSRGVPGNLRTRAVTIERSAPAPPCGVAGGRNGPAVDIQWVANDERDVVEYRVFREAAGAETQDREVCVVAVSERLECYDDQPLDATTFPTAAYYVKAYDPDAGADSAHLTIQQTGNTAPSQPGAPSVAIVDGHPTLSWTASTDSDGTIQFYRIYRGSQSKPAGRLDKTSTSSPGYTDAEAGSGSYTYWVTAVDDDFAESAFSDPVSTSTP